MDKTVKLRVPAVSLLDNQDTEVRKELKIVDQTGKIP